MASCAKCKRPVTKQQESQRVEERTQPDGSVVFFGVDANMAKLADAKGKIKAIYHFKCFFQMRKDKGIDTWVRYLDTSPTAYEEATHYKNRDDLQTPEMERARVAAERLASLKVERDALAARIVADSDDLDDLIVKTDVMDLDDLIRKTEEETALAQRQVEIAEERAKEPTPSSFTDWRDPTTAEF